MSNTTITRETLELAALAIGEEVECTEAWLNGCEDDSTIYTGMMLRGVQEPWRPHADIAEAARLAVRIDALVRVLPLRVEAVVIRDRRLSVKSVPHNGTKSGKECAWCSAITLAAADIGWKMMEG